MKLIVLFFVLAVVIAIQAAPTEQPTGGPSGGAEYTTALPKRSGLNTALAVARDIPALFLMPWLIPELYEDYKKGML